MSDEPVAYSEVAKSLDNYLSNNNVQHLVLSEASHKDLIRNVNLMANREILDVLSKHDHHHINLEARHEFQGGLDAVKRGEMSPEQLAQTAVNAYAEAGDSLAESARGGYIARGNLALIAQEHGVNINFVETQGTLREYVDLLNEQGRLNANQQHEKQGLGELVYDRTVNGALSAAFSAVGATARAEAIDREVVGRQIDAELSMSEDALRDTGGLINKRLSNDGRLAEEITTKSHNEKTVTIYGMTHGIAENDLDEKLGPNTARIVLVTDQAQYIEKSQQSYQSGEQMPSAYLNLATGEMISGKDAYASAEKAHPREQSQPTFLQAALAAAVPGIKLSDSNVVIPEGGFSQQVARGAGAANNDVGLAGQ